MASGIVLEIHELCAWSLGFSGSDEAEITTIAIANAEVARQVRLSNLRDSDWLAEIFKGCDGIRVLDLNESDGAQLEFGRYRLEILFGNGRTWVSVADGCEVRRSRPSKRNRA